MNVEGGDMDAIIATVLLIASFVIPAVIQDKIDRRRERRFTANMMVSNMKYHPEEHICTKYEA